MNEPEQPEEATVNYWEALSILAKLQDVALRDAEAMAERDAYA